MCSVLCSYFNFWSFEVEVICCLIIWSIDNWSLQTITKKCTSAICFIWSIYFPTSFDGILITLIKDKNFQINYSILLQECHIKTLLVAQTYLPKVIGLCDSPILSMKLVGNPILEVGFDLTCPRFNISSYREENTYFVQDS